MKNTIDIHNIEGKVIGQFEMPAQIFGVEVRPELIATALRVYQSKQRQATSKAKTRSEVHHTTEKVWKQKGTGRARHGSKGAPIFVGGGVAFGPTGDQNYDLKLSKKMRQLAIKGAFTAAFKSNSIIIVDGLDKIDATTKAMKTMCTNLNVADSKSVLMIESPLANIVRAGKNLEKLSVVQAKRTNVFEILNTNKLIIHKPAIEVLVNNFAANTVETKLTAKKPVQKKAK